MSLVQETTDTMSLVQETTDTMSLVQETTDTMSLVQETTDTMSLVQEITDTMSLVQETTDTMSLVQETTNTISSGEYDLGHITDDGANLLDLEESKIAHVVVAGCKCKLANGNQPLYSTVLFSMYSSLHDE